MDWADLERRGLYDPEATDAPARREVLEYLGRLGATAEMLTDYGADLGALAADLTLRPPGERLTMAEFAARVGATEDEVRRFRLLMGLPEGRAGEAVMASSHEVVFAMLTGASEFFDEESAERLLRTMGWAMSRVADAVVSTFITTIGPRLMAADASGMALVRANADAKDHLAGLGATLEVILRSHLVAGLRRGEETDLSTGVDVKSEAVLFVDLVGSTALARSLPLSEFDQAVRAFEDLVADEVAGKGGHLVKLIGDEAMVVADDPARAAEIAFGVLEALGAGDGLLRARAGLAWGDVVVRDGDRYGPVVNLASRAVGLAGEGTVVTTADTVDFLATLKATFLSVPLEPRLLKGFDEPVTLFVLQRPGVA